MIRPCDETDVAATLEIINEAAGAYRGVIPDDCWHEPYMTRAELQAEMAAGVRFWCWDRLLETYWSIPVRQRDASVVLVHSR